MAPKQTLAGLRIDVMGTKETRDQLLKLPPKALVNAMSVAAFFAMTPLKRVTELRIPVGLGENSKGKKRPHLRDSITKIRRIYRKDLTVWVSVGVDRKVAPHINMIEFGMSSKGTPIKKPRAAEAQILRKSKIWLLGKLRVGQVMPHPGLKPRAPLRTALASTRTQIERRFISKFNLQIPKEVAKLNNPKKSAKRP